ncbi:N-6 DNA methylase [Agreia sp. PsM10]|uniref:Eco57I restriction-modification methylase domain-containing protein n=1 Tax=Agreia sp. PsM10 TaxID=3030533 RepID=UPI00263B3B5F|nr:N-6 DNA methylase [Agreia sp. PsM10]MDN4638832.1 N-6 DNA methylase [Agreia sp. PsM10]
MVETIKEQVEAVTDASTIPQRILDKITQFTADRDRYRSADFKELALRTEFLNPLLEELGWDPTNRHGGAYSERNVVHEDAVTIDGSTKAPDYGFILDGRRRFFIEAKRPAVNIAEGREAAFQIRRYCWSADLPYGLVTDFEEFAIYDCRAMPNKTDSAHVGRLIYFTYNELPENWHLLRGMFGRENVASGILDLLAAESKPPRGTRPIDEAFLDEIRQWRKSLATDIAAKNLSLSGLEVNGAVQTLIDRIVFLRNAESRGLEAGNALQLAASSEPGLYGRLLTLFKRADDRYNSGLFHLIGGPSDKRVDRIALDLAVDDDILRTIVGRLYFPEPYEFSVLPADILGRIYEQFLGEHITVSSDRVATISLKPEFRKSGGVYYTPTPIVNFMIEEVLGPLLRGKSLNQVAELAIVDPAAGSGSFLIAAYQFLLDWHRDYYASRPTLAKKFLEQGSDNQVRVKTSERKRILLTNLYGVDIDPQAVEVTKLSLLLKVIEGQTQTELEIGRILPDLDSNIACGNSLIGLDFQMPLALEREEQLAFNPFDWKATFPVVFNRGGFDTVIGNPPYLNVDATWGRKDPRLGYLKTKYSSVYADKTDLLFYFLRKAVEISKGEISFIVSRSFLEADKAQKLRGWLAENARVRSIVDFRHAPVFPKVGINTAIIRLSKSTALTTSLFSRYLEKKLPTAYTAATLQDVKLFETVEVPRASLGSAAWNFGDADIQKIVKNMDLAGTPVGKILHVGEGMQTGRNKEFVFNANAPRIAELTRDRVLYQRVRNSDIQRYSIRESGVNMIYVENYLSLSRVPTDVRQHLESFESELKKRAAYERGNCEWWQYTWPLHRDKFDRPRIFVPYRATENRFALDEHRKYLGLTDTTVLYENGQPEDLRYILAILNSRLLTARFRFIGKLLGGGVLEYYENTVSKLPIPRSRPGDATHDRLVALTVIIENAVRALPTTVMEEERQLIQDQHDYANLEIEEIVQGLFGLSDDEVDLLLAQTS